ncbi:hypothetical protein FRX31_013661 [Thalictrum thalictroides]|uniref:Uncharacterized protein n=1 Tax=Thalictrum thalictroides TaxID=46969 RepID=A0A7J6WHC1_THATH|nr:hypothetical protein FRX31_013661 [Thalictrum thalictroides]
MMELVGLPENGNMSSSNLPLEAKNKYRRMDNEEVITDDDDDGIHQHMQNNFSNSSIKRFVIACAIFASLNTVLIGYGMFISPCFIYDAAMEITTINLFQ